MLHPDVVFTIVVLLAFLIKHFVCDFLMQTPWMYQNKGKWMHPGGVFHAVSHGAGTAVIVAATMNPLLIVIAMVVDTVLHYAIDYAKVNISAQYGWAVNKPGEGLLIMDNKFFVMFGLDQLLHMLTYVGIIVLVVSN